MRNDRLSKEARPKKNGQTSAMEQHEEHQKMLEVHKKACTNLSYVHERLTTKKEGSKWRLKCTLVFLAFPFLRRRPPSAFFCLHSMSLKNQVFIEPCVSYEEARSIAQVSALFAFVCFSSLFLPFFASDMKAPSSSTSSDTRKDSTTTELGPLAFTTITTRTCTTLVSPIEARAKQPCFAKITFGTLSASHHLRSSRMV